MMTIGNLEEMTIDEVRNFQPQVVVVPIGSTEPHGSHLAYGTDTCICEAVTRRAVERANLAGARALRLPVLPISNNVNLKAFPFACRIGVNTLMNVILDIIQALEEDGIRKIVLVNSHGGNTDTLRATLRTHMDRHRPQNPGAFVCIAGTTSIASAEALNAIEHRSSHAGEGETSQMLHLRPDLVHCDKLGEQPTVHPLLRKLEEGTIAYVIPWHAYMPQSGGGQTDRATADKGRALIDSAADNLSRFLVELDRLPWSPTFPFPPAD